MSYTLDRLHPILAARAAQIGLNRAAAEGGREYVRLRLRRAANESDLSWGGDPSKGLPGRRERTRGESPAGRVAQKIEQYIFSEPASRAGADPAFLSDATGDGRCLDALMQDVCREITTSGWCWIRVSAPAWDVEAGRTLAERRASGWRICWGVWPAPSVINWRLTPAGGIDWLVTASDIADDADPRKEPRSWRVLTLYKMDGGRVTVTDEAGGGCPFPLRSDEVIPGLTRIPFVLAGRPSAAAWWFDTTEEQQSSLMNLQSLHEESLVSAVYPQLVVPASAIDNLEVKMRVERGAGDEEIARLVREIVRGRSNPFAESPEEKGLSRYIMPDAGAMKPMTDEIARLRKALFDDAGMGLFNRETRQVQSADSKRFDQLDTQSALRHRALALQEAEAAAVAISREVDPLFRGWEPAYPSRFDVFDSAAASAAIQVAANMPDTVPSMRRMAMIAAVKLLQGVAPYDRALVDGALEEIRRAALADGAADDDGAGDPPAPGGDE